MRKWILLVLVLGLLAAGWPWYVGGQVEDTLEAGLDTQAGGLELRHELDEYRRGYREASARGTLHLTLQDEEYRIPLLHEVHHGVLGARVRTRLDTDELDTEPGDAPELADVLRQLDPRADSRSGLGGGLTTRVKLSGVRMDIAEWPAMAAWQTAEGPAWLEFGEALLQLAWSDEQALVSMSIPRLRLDQAGGTLELEGVRQVLALEPDVHGSWGPLPDFEGGVAVDRLEWVRPGCGNGVMLHRARINAFQTRHEDRLDSRARLEIENMEVADAGWREARRSGPVDVQLGMERWDRAALVELVESLRDPSFRALDPDQRRDLTHAAILDAISASLERSPAISLKGTMNTAPERHLELDGELVLSGAPERFRVRPMESVALDIRAGVGLEWPDSLEGLAQPDPLHRFLAAAEADAWLEREGERLDGHLVMRDGRIFVQDRDRTASALGLLFAVSGGMF
ncbi:DUF945 family protein [Thioalkalivibrio sp. ALJ24]|uniref:DUF945 family protein n=1 Tax=Thioalkalivibrio sp. ALJ24 TaxID=545276 RepID=UPI000379A320|nr:DUF945 family protein [Thioalkalivibrio sp. ALJ24]